MGGFSSKKYREGLTFSIGVLNYVSSNSFLYFLHFFETSFSDFLKSISSIPKDISFKEELLDYQISIDGSMANVWTPYKFYFNDSLSHCGVNSFQLVKINGKWQIIYIIDTRRKEKCE